MLKLDPFSENVLFQCDRCRFVGELITAIIEEEGSFYCWNCLHEMNQRVREEKRDQYAIS
jgi:hypothetical protein